ncbi:MULTISPECIES: hypothetical protein [Paenibacillus]|uniref:hypothetical protein n=1 Tax=Paenibacillus TaxID=44249 RepID=UPI0013D5F807|nr:hypothetical protein [Paenibacillus sp. ALJ109b]NEU61579.1 hypothetical protein [Paenibacillus sp. ALJ109b]
MSNEALSITNELYEQGYNAYTGVPCSLLKGLFRILEDKEYVEKKEIVYMPAIREDSALGVAVGMHLGGRKCAILMQNSGLGYSMNVLTSLYSIYQIPALLIISWRGAFENDAVEHDLIGERLLHVLDAIKIPYVEFDKEHSAASVKACTELIEKNSMPVALLIKEAI